MESTVLFTLNICIISNPFFTDHTGIKNNFRFIFSSHNLILRVSTLDSEKNVFPGKSRFSQKMFSKNNSMRRYCASGKNFRVIYRFKKCSQFK